VIQELLAKHYHVLTNEQFNEAVVITRSSSGPVGLYIVSVGYFVAGLPGAVARWLAMECAVMASAIFLLMTVAENSEVADGVRRSSFSARPTQIQIM
jgi:chromate transport protein ChrA